jgi:hypothetical protein
MLSRKWSVGVFLLCTVTSCSAAFVIAQPWFAGVVPSRFDIGRLVFVCAGYALMLTGFVVTERSRRKRQVGQS